MSDQDGLRAESELGLRRCWCAPHLSLLSEAARAVSPPLLTTIADLFRFAPVLLLSFPLGHTALVILLLLVS